MRFAQGKHTQDHVVNSIQKSEGADVPAGPDTGFAFDANMSADATDKLSSLHAFASLEERKAQEKHRRRKRIIIVSIVAGVLVVGGIAFGLYAQARKASQSGQTSTAQVTQGDFTNTVNVSGNLAPASETIVTPEVDGIIESVMVSAGSTVQAGDVLFTLKNDALDTAVNQASQQVRTAQNSVTAAQVALDNAHNTYASAEAAYNASLAAPTTPATPGAGTGTGSGSGTGAQTPTVTFDPVALNDAIRAAEVTLNGAYIALDGAQQTYDEAARTAGKRTVTAPCGGDVIAVNAKPGAQVGASLAASAPLVQIASLTQMRMTVQVNEMDIPKLAVGQKATVTFTAVPGLTLDASVKSVALVSSASTSTAASLTSGSQGASGVVTYAVELAIPQPDKRLKPGMTGAVTITTEQLPNVLMVPVAAIQMGEGDKATIIVVTDAEAGTTEKRTVTVKTRSTTTAVVEGDIQAGDTVQMVAASSDASSTSTN